MKDRICPYVHIPQLSGALQEDARRLLTENNKEKTYAHVLAVSETNMQIAEKFNLDREICRISGLLHDISAIIRPADMLTYAQANHYDIDESERRFPFLFHQRLSRVLSQELFHVTDPRILSAVECHSTLKSEPTPYDMSLFIADKLSWDGDGIPPYQDAVRKGLEESLESASLAYMNHIVDHNMILFPHQWFTKGKRYLEEHMVKQASVQRIVDTV